MVKIALVAGEPSGDQLGAGLITELKKHFASIEWSGIGGPQMIAAGFNSCMDMQKLSVMGIKEALLHYPSLFKIRKQLYNDWKKNPPDVFIGIDYPYFNLSLELRLKKRGIKTVHMVSPKIWARRPQRVLQIKKAVDLMLTLFPFEEAFYQKYDVPVCYIGYPLADRFPMNNDPAPFRKQFAISPEAKVVCVLPGSRKSELHYMAPLFLDVMQQLSRSQEHIEFLIPAATPALKEILLEQLARKGYQLKLKILDKQAHEAMSAADLVLAKSGTATLEALLLKRPMVVAFKWSPINHVWITRQLTIEHVALPNILAGKELVPEFIQKKAQPESIVKTMITLLDAKNTNAVKKEFAHIHQQLQCNANQKAAEAIIRLLHSSL